jgi:cytochrome P450
MIQVTVQRKVLKPFTLPSGAYIPPGNLIAVPQQAIARSPHNYPDPKHFDGYRFLPKHEEQRQTDAMTKFTDGSYLHPYWGPPGKAW